MGNHEYKETGSKFNEFKPRLKSAKKQFQLSAGLILEKLKTILSGTNQPYIKDLLKET